MTTPPLAARLSLAGGHPAVAARRLRELALLAAGVLVPLVLATAISVAVPKPNVLLAVGITIGGVIVVALMVVPRLEVTVMIAALYLALLDGPVKLGVGGHHTVSAVRDVLIAAVALGALMRVVVSRERIRLPAMAAWPLAFVAVVVVEAFNPNTAGISKVLGGFRQQLEWVPFFFFGYAIMRSRARFRRALLLLGVLALANGAVATYQSRIGPSGLASWGPGYHELVYGGGEGGITGRTYFAEGEARVRPPGLGSDAGFGAGVGVVGLVGGFALLAVGPFRRRWPAVVLALGAMLAVVTGTGRLQVVGAVLSLLLFALLSFKGGKRASRPLVALLIVFVLAVPLGALFVSINGSSTFARYGSTGGQKTAGLRHIPSVIAAQPFGIGLGTVGAAAGFGGVQKTALVEGHGTTAETEYNMLTDELGLPGLVLWIALTIRLLTLVLPRLGRVRDFELRLYLTGITATLIAFTLMGLEGPTMASAAFGPFFWFATGTLAYWFAGPGWSKARLQVAP
jgi:hypothetical protein